MNTKLTLITIVGIVACVAASGCAPFAPEPPKDEQGNVIKIMYVTAGDKAELAAVTELETARVNYLYRLFVLRSYYEKAGNLDKLR